jgi:hypothetical protein
MFGKLKVLSCLLAAIIQVTPLFAEESAEEAKGFHLGFALGIGTSTFQEEGDSVTYQKLVLSPDISFGRFGIGLDLSVHYTFTGPPPDGNDFYVRPEDWIPSGDDGFLDVYLAKFRYVRYGQKGDPLFAKLGSIDDMTLGNGFIMHDYSNALFLPEKRIFGLNLNIDGALFNVPIFGFESVIGNLAQFDVLALRPYVRPLAGTSIPILQDLQLGVTLAADAKPGLYAGDPEADPVLVFGMDFFQPLIAKPAVRLAAFGDIASVHGRSMGGMVGAGGRLIGFLLYGAQIRVLGEDFIPAYFDAAYDLFRYDKYQIVLGGQGNPFSVGWLATLGLSLLNDSIVFSTSLEGPFRQHGTGNYLDYPRLYAIFRIMEGIIPSFSLDASYDKRMIGSFADLVDPEDAVIGARLNYHAGAAVITFLYNLRYVPNPGPGESNWEVTSGLESSIQLF